MPGRFTLLKRAHGGADLSRRSIAPRKAPFYALSLAVSVAVTNRRALETFEAKITKAGDVKPKPSGRDNFLARERRLDAARLAARTGAGQSTTLGDSAVDDLAA